MMTNNDTLTGTLGTRVMLLMKHQHLSGKELAEAVGVSGVFISQIVNQGKDPSVETLRKLADALHTTTDYLLCRSDVPYAEEGDTRAYSAEGDEAANIVDALSPQMRATVMGHLRLVLQQQTAMADTARASMSQFGAQLRASGLILTETEMGAIAALIRDITGVDVALGARRK